MENFSYWAFFFSSVIILTITPGPDLIFMMTQTLAKGTKTGMASAAGVYSGAMVHVTFAALGLSAVLAASAAAFTAVKILGACYLVYLGIKTLRTAGKEVLKDRTKELTIKQAFRQGFFIDVFNPKVAIFFMAFLPQFVRSDSGPAWSQLLFLGLLVVFTGFAITAGILGTAGYTSGLFRYSKKTSAVMNRILGTLFIGMGIKLALIHRN